MKLGDHEPDCVNWTKGKEGKSLTRHVVMFILLAFWRTYSYGNEISQTQKSEVLRLQGGGKVVSLKIDSRLLNLARCPIELKPGLICLISKRDKISPLSEEEKRAWKTAPPNEQKFAQILLSISPRAWGNSFVSRKSNQKFVSERNTFFSFREYLVALKESFSSARDWRFEGVVLDRDAAGRDIRVSCTPHYCIAERWSSVEPIRVRVEIGYSSIDYLENFIKLSDDFVYGAKMEGK